MGLDTRIRLSKLEVYCTVVELESVTAAAKELFISQPVVTSHVRMLEDRLGTKLLYRDGHSMRTTEAGKLAYDWAKDVLTRSHEMARGIEGLADGSAGSAAVAASMTVGSYILPAILTRFRQARPLARIGLDTFDPEHVVSGIESGRYDIGVLIADGHALDSSLVFEQIGQEEFLLVAGPEADIGDSIDATDLPEIEMIGSPQHRVREDLLTDLLARAGLEHGPIAIELGHAEAMKRAVKESDCLSFLFAASVRDELSRGDLRQVHIKGAGPLATPIYLAHRDRKDFSALQAALVEAIRADLA